MITNKMMGLDIKMDEARKVIDAMLHAAISTPDNPDNSNTTSPMALAVVDTAGAPVYVVRMDGASTLNARVAINKAFTAIDTRRDTIDSDNSLKQTGRDIAHFSTGELRLTYIPGGVLIRAEDGSIVGAVGTSGRPPTALIGDEEIARIGAKAFLRL